MAPRYSERTKLVLLRCVGFNNVDLPAAAQSQVRCFVS